MKEWLAGALSVGLRATDIKIWGLILDRVLG